MTLINLLLSSEFIIQGQSVLWIEFFGCQTNNRSSIFFFKWYFSPFTDKITEIISPYLFLKYWSYNNTFTYLFFPPFFLFFNQPILNYEKYPFFRLRLQL